MKSKLSKIVSKTILAGLFIYFIYIFVEAIKIVNRRQISTDNGIYINSTTDSEYIKKITKTLTKHCKNDICKVQSILDFVTNIPYKINNFQAKSPKETIKKNFGDCDDKSNLLISMLHELGFESYFVLVPNHIFVIVRLDDIHLKYLVEGLYINRIKYYILESTAKNSKIGFPLQRDISDIQAVLEPFENRKLDIKSIRWGL
jgi:hypothetical protein